MFTLYSYNGRDAKALRRQYAEVIRKEFYEGELLLDASDNFDVSIEKAIGHPISLVRVVTRSGISFRRSWAHIRSNQIGVRVIWFVRRGRLEVVRSQKSYEVLPNEWCILDSSMPFFAHASPEENSSFDAIQAIVPAHVFLSHLPGITELNRAFPIAVGGQKTIARYLDLLFGEGERLSRSAAEPLATSFLKVISDSLSNLVAELPRRKRLIDQRFEDIEAYVAKNLTDPDLNYIEVAAKCGISARYFCHVLKEHGTSFSELLWSQRLRQARNWLESGEYQDHPIYQIAFMAGFKSAAHFSRMFKEFHGCSPREFRATRDTHADVDEGPALDAAEAPMPPRARTGAA